MTASECDATSRKHDADWAHSAQAYSLLGFEHLDVAEHETAHSSLHTTQQNDVKCVSAYLIAELWQ